MNAEMMSGPPSGQNDSSLYAMCVDELVSYFSSLVEHARTLAFPPLRRGATAPPDMTGWSELRRRAFVVSTPFPTTWSAATNDFTHLMFLLWSVVALYFGSAASYVFTNRIFGALPPSTSQPEQTIWSIVLKCVIWVLWALAIVWAPVAYWHWVEFLRDRRFSIFYRVLLTLLFLGAVILSVKYGILNSEARGRFPNLLCENRVLMLRFLGVCLLYVIPMVTYFYRLTLDMILMGGRSLYMILAYLRAIHTPISEELVRNIALGSIPIAGNETRRWSLAELTRVELESLRKWAEMNREGTDKRLLPSALFFGVLGIFADTQAFSGMVDKVLNMLVDGFTLVIGVEDTPSPAAQSGFVVLLIVLVLAIVFANVMLSLFRNLVIQSLIVEACIAAEYACRQSRSLTPPHQDRRKSRGFWEWLLRLVHWR